MLALICTGQQHAVVLLTIMATYIQVYAWLCNHAEPQTVQHNRMLYMCQHHGFLVSLSQ